MERAVDPRIIMIDYAVAAPENRNNYMSLKENIGEIVLLS